MTLEFCCDGSSELQILLEVFFFGEPLFTTLNELNRRAATCLHRLCVVPFPQRAFVTLRLDAAAINRRLAIAPPSCRFSAMTMQRWAACVQLRVIDGLSSKIQQTMAATAGLSPPHELQSSGTRAYLRDSIIEAAKREKTSRLSPTISW